MGESCFSHCSQRLLALRVPGSVVEGNPSPSPLPPACLLRLSGTGCSVSCLLVEHDFPGGGNESRWSMLEALPSFRANLGAGLQLRRKARFLLLKKSLVVGDVLLVSVGF